jgi:ribosome-associated toxin RatA of RatAB toxin-antitoxin module
MTKLVNEIIINAPVEKIWKVLSNLEELEKYDPAVNKSVLLTAERSGLGASRKVDMKDGKNWFEEKVIAWKPNETLTYQLTACSFPIHGLKHSYSFRGNGSQTKVQQVMEYKIKFGLFGKLLDKLMIRKQTDSGIKKFLGGLKHYVEKNN